MFITIRAIFQDILNKIESDKEKNINVPSTYEELTNMFDNLAKWHTNEVDAAEKRGEQKGGIKATIEELVLFNVSKENIIKRLCAKYNFSEKQASEYYKLYHE